jgi:hypothetical protein
VLVMADFADSTPLTTPTDPDATTSKLSAAQTFRMRIARDDLDRAREMDLATASNADLQLILGAITSSLYSVLQIAEDLGRGES